eukprot:scaffold203469_cov66-Cyclotella_meneghiniana.AAC.10
MKRNPSDIPQYTEDEIERRMGRTTRLVQKKMEEKINGKTVSIEMLNPHLTQNGKFMKVGHGETVMCTIKELHILAEVLQIMGIFQGIDQMAKLGRVRQLIYIIVDKQYKDSISSSTRTVNNILNIISNISGIPRSLFPISSGECSERIYGEFSFLVGQNSYSCQDGMWHYNDNLPKSLYMSGEIELENVWGVSEDFNKAEHLICCEKDYIASRYLEQLPVEERGKYIILVSGGIMSKSYLTMKKFICEMKKATGMKFQIHHWLGDVDVGSLTIAYSLEYRAEKSLGPSEDHLLDEMHIVGPYPKDGMYNEKIGEGQNKYLEKWKDPDASMFLSNQGEDRVTILEGFSETGMNLHMEHLPIKPWFDCVHKRIVGWRLTKMYRDIRKFVKWREEKSFNKMA